MSRSEKEYPNNTHGDWCYDFDRSHYSNLACLKFKQLSVGYLRFLDNCEKSDKEWHLSMMQECKEYLEKFIQESKI